MSEKKNSREGRIDWSAVEIAWWSAFEKALMRDSGEEVVRECNGAIDKISEDRAKMDNWKPKDQYEYRVGYCIIKKNGMTRGWIYGGILGCANAVRRWMNDKRKLVPDGGCIKFSVDRRAVTPWSVIFVGESEDGKEVV